MPEPTGQKRQEVPCAHTLPWPLGNSTRWSELSEGGSRCPPPFPFCCFLPSALTFEFPKHLLRDVSHVQGSAGGIHSEHLDATVDILLEFLYRISSHVSTGCLIFQRHSNKVAAVRTRRLNTRACTSLTFCPGGPRVLLQQRRPENRHIRDQQLKADGKGQVARSAHSKSHASTGVELPCTFLTRRQKAVMPMTQRAWGNGGENKEARNILCLPSLPWVLQRTVN